jgi:hypothetical protein
MSLFKPFFIFGPEIGILLSENEKIEISGTSALDTNSLFRKIKMKPFDFGLNFGGGAEFEMKRIIPFIQVGYYWGLINIDNNSADDLSTKNIVFFVQAGVRFKINK